MRYYSLRVLLAITKDDLEAIQFDVRTAFLYGELLEDIHIEVSASGLRAQGLNVDKEKNVSAACKLSKSLYGLKQAPRCWNAKFSNFLRQFNLKETDADKCIFFGSFQGSEIYLALFVDDDIIAAKSKGVLESIVKTLSETFEITLGNYSTFVGLQIEQDRVNKTMFIHQSAYAKQIIEKFGIKNSKILRSSIWVLVLTRIGIC